MVRIHSVVGLVTNSSSETYMFIKNDEEGVDNLKLFIDSVLIAGGSPMRADDLFEFELVPKWSYLDDVIEYAKERAEEEGTTPEEVLEDHWLAGAYPKGIHDLQITVKPGVEAPSDIARILGEVFDGQDISSEW